MGRRYDAFPCVGTAKPDAKRGVLKLRDAALQLGISFPTIKQWIYKKDSERPDCRRTPPHPASGTGQAVVRDARQNGEGTKTSHPSRQWT